MMTFSLDTKDKNSGARTGTITTGHGTIHTPIFMPVGTAGTVKGITAGALKDDVRAEIILGNTYHLYLRPGTDVLHEAGGLHSFASWNLPILTDSGGYQVFSLAGIRKIKEDGVEFRSHIDGSRHLFTPERVMDIQRAIGADIIMAFDECPPIPSEMSYVSKSLDLTMRWLERCCRRLDETEPLYGHHQSLFPIVQGGIYPALRREAAARIAALNREGNAIGGLSVGEPAETMYEITALVCDILPEDKPRYLMGVGTPANILESIALGVDMFDCVMPTRNGRNGWLFTSEGTINIRNNKWKNDFSPIDPEGTSALDVTYSKAYLRHLFLSGEMLGPVIASTHNIAFYLKLVRQAAEHIRAGDFTAWKNQMVPRLESRI